MEAVSLWMSAGSGQVYLLNWQRF